MVDVPPLHEFWKAPASKNDGDKDATVIYEAVGYALSIWEGLETVIAALFKVLVESKTNAASRAYGGVGSHTARLDLLKNAAEAFFIVHNVSKEHQSEFNKLTSHLKDASGRRNEIAHGYVVHHTYNNKEVGCFLFPPNYNTRKTKPAISIEEIRAMPDDDPFVLSTAKYRYTRSDILEFVEKFFLLKKWAYEVRNSMLSYYPKPLPDAPQEARPKPSQQ